MDEINIYCDESCHLPNDGKRAMTLGALWCSAAERRDVTKRIQEIKRRHSLGPTYELKWTKVSAGKQQFYLDILDYFFDNPSLHFRAVVIPDKTKLTHREHNQDHDTWIYKMYFTLLEAILRPDAAHYIYLDIKDTRGGVKAAKLHEILCNSKYDFERTRIRRVQIIRSEESELLQLADFLIGAVSYANRGEGSNAGKLAVLSRARVRSGYDLTRSTLLRESKFNVFRWAPWEKES